MSLWDWLTGTKNTSQSESVSTSKNENVDSTSLKTGTTGTTTQTGATQATSQQQDTTQSSITRLLSGETQSVLENLVSTIAGSAGGVDTASKDFAGFMSDFAKSLNDKNAGDINAIISEAERTGTQALKQNITSAAGSTGSALNTIVADLANRGKNELTTQLAGKRGELNLASNNQVIEALKNAMTGLSQTDVVGQEKVKNLAYLVSALKGATTEQTATGGTSTTGLTEEQQTVQQLQSLLEAIQTLTSGTTVSSSTGTSEGSQSGTIFDLLKALS